MQLQLLQETDYLSIFYDSTNDWLFIDWRGNLTLPIVQASCLVIAQCFLERPYPRILNSNSQVTGMSADVPMWLAHDYLPHLSLAGVEYLAWVQAPALLLQHLTNEAVRQLTEPVVTLFTDLDLAFSWLQHTRFHHLDTAPAQDSDARQAELSNRVEQLATYYQRIMRCITTQQENLPQQTD